MNVQINLIELVTPQVGAVLVYPKSCLQKYSLVKKTNKYWRSSPDYYTKPITKTTPSGEQIKVAIFPHVEPGEYLLYYDTYDYCKGLQVFANRVTEMEWS